MSVPLVPAAAAAATTRDPDEVAAWLRLTMAPGLRPATVRRLLALFGLPERMLRLGAARLATVLPAPAARALLAPPDARMAALIARTVAWLREPGHHLVTLADGAYPRALLDLADAPPLLHVRGDLAALHGQAVAIVGARNATLQGGRDARAVAQALSGSGVTVVSGMALGIDAAAHAGALDAAGATVAVVGTGVDVVYPSRHRALADRIAGQGAIVSEFALGTPPRAHHFPQRNRLIAALSRGVLVVEAALRSGSLITARLAAELGRDVFAMPGSIHAPLARGCHRLIRDGAALVESAQDVLDELGLGRRASPPKGSARPAVTAVPADALGAALAHDPLTIDAICERCGLSPEAVVAELFRLEMDGGVERLPGGRYRRLAAQ